MSFPLLPTFSSSPHPFYLAQLRVSLSPSFLWKRGRKKDKGMEGRMHFLENSSSLPLCFVGRERGGGISANVSPSPAFVTPTRAEERPCPLSSSFRGEGLLPIVASPPTAALTLWAWGGRDTTMDMSRAGKDAPLSLHLFRLSARLRSQFDDLSPATRALGAQREGKKGSPVLVVSPKIRVISWPLGLLFPLGRLSVQHALNGVFPLSGLRKKYPFLLLQCPSRLESAIMPHR